MSRIERVGPLEQLPAIPGEDKILMACRNACTQREKQRERRASRAR